MGRSPFKALPWFVIAPGILLAALAGVALLRKPVRIAGVDPRLRHPQAPGAALDRLAAAHDVEVWPDPLPPPREELLARVADAGPALDAHRPRRRELLDRSAAPARDRQLRRGLRQRGPRRPPCARHPARQHPGRPDRTPPPTSPSRSCSPRRGASRSPPPTPARARGTPGSPTLAGPRRPRRGRSGSSASGHIGRAVAKRAAGFDMTVIHTRETRSRSSSNARTSSRCHAPLTPETHHLIDAAALHA